MPHSLVLVFLIFSSMLLWRSLGLRMRMSSSARPSLDDVERISRGQAAKKRGTGSRNVPHRLNEMERREWDLAKKRRYLLVRGTGWRKERGDSPLANIYRQLCDAHAVPCISVQRGVGGGADGSLLEIVTVDLSPLRTLEFDDVVAIAKSESETFPSLVSLEDNTETALRYTDAPAEEIFGNEVIWRIQAYGVTAKFSSRREAKSFAEVIARRTAGGQLATTSDKALEEEED